MIITQVSKASQEKKFIIERLVIAGDTAAFDRMEDGGMKAAGAYIAVTQQRLPVEHTAKRVRRIIDHFQPVFICNELYSFYVTG